MLIVLPLAHISNKRGPWVLRGSSPVLEVQDHLEAGFKYPEIHRCGKFHYLEGPMHGVRDPKEEWSRDFLFKFLEAQKTFPPCHAVWCREYYRLHPEDPFGVQTSLSVGDDKREDLETEERLNKRF